MSRHIITHACGHEKAHDLLGPMRQRDQKADWLATTDCRDCFLAHLDTLPPEVYANTLDAEKVAFVVTRSYAVKDALKARGYRYGHYAVGISQVLQLAERRPPSGWRLICDTRNQALAELDWLKEQGWSFAAPNQLPRDCHDLAGLTQDH